MDYCHPCRRHLNGALACPGCGTPAEACREYAQSVAAREEPDGYGDAYDEESPRTGGRSRRRERGRRAHRRKRRRILLVTAGLALAAGGLSLAELGAEGPSEERTTAAAPDGDAARTPSAKGMPDPEDSTSDGTATADQAAASASATQTKDKHKGKEGKKKEREEKKARESEEAGGEGESDERPDPSSPTESAPQGDTPGPSRPASPPPASEKPQPTQPSEPTPTETCDRFLWWCT